MNFLLDQIENIANLQKLLNKDRCPLYSRLALGDRKTSLVTEMKKFTKYLEQNLLAFQLSLYKDVTNICRYIK